MFLKVNGVIIPDPSDFRVGVMDISNAQRNAKGSIIIERIATKIKLEMRWKYLPPTELSKLLRGVSTPNFTVDYLDPRTNIRERRVFYVGDRNMGMYSYVNGEPIYVDIGFNFIEV